MEVKGAALLYAMAGLMITFAGFSALLMAVRPAAGAKSSLLDRYLARTVMTYVFVLTAGSLLPPILALYDLPEYSIWRWAGVLFALPMLVLQTTYPLRRRHVIGSWPPAPILAVFVVLGSAVTAALMGCIVLGVTHIAAVYITAVTADFFTVVFGFLTAIDVIMEQPLENG